jgi:hypothetical protein
MTLAAPVWTFWLAVPIAAGAVLMLIAMIAGYLKNVSSTRYPSGDSGE